jgi:hypothetical protein
VTDAELKSLRAEKSYLEWMTRYTGALLRRESEMNRVMMEQCPGMYGMVPHVQVMDYEVRNIKDHARKDKNMWHYFQNHFTRLTGIPSVPHKEIL